MTLHNKQIGDRGEQIAVDQLTQKGFQILRRKARSQSGEVDIIAEKNGQVHFVEVKTRTTTEMGYPESAITPTRYKRMQICAQEFALEMNISSFQIDLISILLQAHDKSEVYFFDNI